MNIPLKTVKIGIIGAGSMGKKHIRVACSNPLMECVGVFDPNEMSGNSVAEAYGIIYYHDIDQLISEVDAIIIASPTVTHFEVAKNAINKGVHCLIEKPITVTVKEGEKLLALADEKKLTIQVGHVERHNPVFEELIKILENEEILSIQASRLSYNVSRATDVDVVLDLMIHDLDTINQLLGGDLVICGAVGRKFHSPVNDYASAMFTSKSGAIAEVTASKISQTKMRSLTISCSDCFIVVDYLRKEIEINRHAVSKYVSDKHHIKYKHESLVERVYVPNLEPLMAEHNNFAENILFNKVSVVSGYAGLEALKLAIKVQKACTQ